MLLQQHMLWHKITLFSYLVLAMVYIVYIFILVCGILYGAIWLVYVYKRWVSEGPT